MRRLLFAVVISIAIAVPIVAQQRAITADDYARAEKFLSAHTTPLVLRSGVRPTWLEDGRFWYRVTTERGSEAFLVDPVKASKVPCDLPACKQPEAGRGRGGRGGAPTGATNQNTIPSPDGKRTAFIREHNLWVRDVASGK